MVGLSSFAARRQAGEEARLPAFSQARARFVS
jgi:hypothetical protein